MSSIVREDSPPSEDAAPQTAESNASTKTSYGQILKSTALIGGSSAVNIAIGIVRVKVMAVLLGPSGFGLMGLYGSIADLANSVAGMGISSSGVRQIAEADTSEDRERIARTVTVLRRVSLVLGLMGAVLLVALSRQASILTFNSEAHVGAIALLSLAVLFRLVSGAQGALIQGMRRIADLAKINTIGALFGLLITIPIVYLYRDQGVVPSLVAVAAASLMISWWYSRKISIPISTITTADTWREAVPLLKLGFAFMASGLMMMGSAYVVRIIVLHKVGFEATGLYQAAWTLGGLYVGLILQAMGADFYPRLTASAGDNVECNRLVNEQTRVGVLIGGPGVIATLTLAPVVITLFYSSNFTGAVELLRWICLGVALRVIAWPIGFIVVAKGRQGIFLLTEISWTVVNIGLTWVCVDRFGLNGAGIAFFGSYVFYVLLMYPIVHKLSGFQLTIENKWSSALFFAVVSAVFSSFYFLPSRVAIYIGAAVSTVSIAYSVRILLTLVALDQVPIAVRRLLIGLGLAPSRA